MTTSKDQYKLLEGRIITVRGTAPHLQLIKVDGRTVWLELPITEFANNLRSYVIKQDAIKDLLGQHVLIYGYSIPRDWGFSFRAMEIKKDRLIMSSADAQKYLEKDRDWGFFLIQAISLFFGCIYLFRHSFSRKS